MSTALNSNGKFFLGRQELGELALWEVWRKNYHAIFSCSLYTICFQDTEATHQTSKALYNLSSYNTDSFTLLGIPGLEQYHVWISMSFCFIYLVAIMGNSTLLYLIAVEQSSCTYVLSPIHVGHNCSHIVYHMCPKNPYYLLAWFPENQFSWLSHTVILSTLQLCPGLSYIAHHGI